jgi:hypothetical protein
MPPGSVWLIYVVSFEILFANSHSAEATGIHQEKAPRKYPEAAAGFRPPGGPPLPQSIVLSRERPTEIFADFLGAPPDRAGPAASAKFAIGMLGH